MTMMTVKSPSRTRPAIARIELEISPLLEETLAWLALAGFAAVCFLTFALAIDLSRDRPPSRAPISATCPP